MQKDENLHFFHNSCEKYVKHENNVRLKTIFGFAHIHAMKKQNHTLKI